jgi:hypothetical protein
LVVERFERAVVDRVPALAVRDRALVLAVPVFFFAGFFFAGRTAATAGFAADLPTFRAPFFAADLTVRAAFRAFEATAMVSPS